MDIDVIYFELTPSKKKIACMAIKYYDLVMNCDLVYYPKKHKAWIRMPERWLTKKQKTSYCCWPNKEISDQFQKEVLKKILDKYDLDIDKVFALHRSRHQKYAKKKSVDII